MPRIGESVNRRNGEKSFAPIHRFTLSPFLIFTDSAEHLIIKGMVCVPLHLQTENSIRNFQFFELDHVLFGCEQDIALKPLALPLQIMQVLRCIKIMVSIRLESGRE